VDGVVAAKVVVTGLEVETRSYGRIGELGVLDALAGDLDLVRVQPSPSGSHVHRVVLTAEAEERLGGPAWYSYDVAARLVGPLYPLYREPPRHSVAV
jgi:ribosomal protein S12 methylthiotransferase accessory factor